MNSLDPDFQAKLQDLKKGVIDLISFRQWMDAHQVVLKASVSQGVLLKLRRGNMEKVMGCISNLVPACQKCTTINQVGDFSSRAEFSICALLVDKALDSGVINRIKQPGWLKPLCPHAGSGAYYQCKSCSTIWVLVEPEREDRGSWQRLN